MARVLVETGLAADVKVINIPGAQGVTGLQAMLSTYRGDGTALMIGGRSLADAPESGPLLRQMIPVARITGEYEVLAFPGGRETESMDNVAAALHAKPRKLPRVSLSYLQEQGMDPSLANWRGVFAPPGLSAAEIESLGALIGRLVKTPEWRTELDRARSTDFYLPGTQFGDFLAAAAARETARNLAAQAHSANSSPLWRLQLWLLRRRMEVIAFLLAGILLGGAYVVYRHRAWSRQEGLLSQELAVAREDVSRGAEEHAELLRGVSRQIDSQMVRWHLTEAEQEVALLMLKGLRHNEIADLRNTSERTVRQQAAAIYKKAGISGRTELAAFFLEDFLETVPLGRTARR